MYDQTTTLVDFLAATAAKQPTPGGGSVAALAGALAAAIGEMTLNYSVGRKANKPDANKVLSAALAKLTRVRGMLVELMVEDQGAYEALTAARKLPDSASDKQQRIDLALLACIRIPQSTAACGLAIVELCDKTCDLVNPHLLSDLAVCAELAMTTVRAGLYNVRSNLPAVADVKERNRLSHATEQLLVHATAAIKHCGPRIWERFRGA